MSSELEVLIQTADYQMRKYILDLVETKTQLKKRLSDPNLSVNDEMEYKEALEILTENLNRLRFSGNF